MTEFGLGVPKHYYGRSEKLVRPQKQRATETISGRVFVAGNKLFSHTMFVKHGIKGPLGDGLTIARR